MAQIQSPETYVDGQQVTAARLNNQTNGAVALAGLITDQSNITANTVASGDSVLLYDLSATALREANISDVLGSNLPVTTSAVTAGANSDIVLTPNDGTIVTGQAYTSADGLTVTVTSTAHALTVGQVILVTAAATGYNGTFRVATVLTNSFTYVMTTAAAAGSSTLSYTKKGAVRNTGSESVAGSLFVAGTAVISGATDVSGATTLTGALTSNGTANFTGAIQYDGIPVYGLASITEASVTTALCSAGNATEVTNTCNQWITLATLSSLTKTNKEIWEVEAIFNVAWSNITQGQNQCKFRIILVSSTAVLAESYKLDGPFSQLCFFKDQVNLSATIEESTVLTNDSIRVEIFYFYPYSPGQSGFLKAGPHGDQFEAGTTNKTKITKYIKP